MKIDENLVNKGKKRVYTKSSCHSFYPIGILDEIFFSHQFSPQGRAGGFHALRAAAYSAYVIKGSQ
jgi:hypothetical protein